MIARQPIAHTLPVRILAAVLLTALGACNPFTSPTTNALHHHATIHSRLLWSSRRVRRWSTWYPVASPGPISSARPRSPQVHRDPGTKPKPVAVTYAAPVQRSPTDSCAYSDGQLKDGHLHLRASPEG
jgi:hypothetical protein